ncbi:hypothetical protein LOCC1_G006652 [Lachnellula occidentalis]|uniref:F-box domain-containing protein n=1 Tax=Lachnellula occidentalis TaxID=215460 RepID=A0A8H8RHL8_9HELO|nr:hypothetical protein LOCC1_G006652 [Lachnellula occidentalis]
MADMPNLLNLRKELQLKINSHLDKQSRSALATVLGQDSNNLLLSSASNQRPTVATAHVTFASESYSSHSSDSDNDTLASTDTEISPSPEEEAWAFKQTPELMNRLTLLPQYKDSASLPNLPIELQLEVFGYLDKIDACCLGLTSTRSYGIFRAIHGTKMPLNQRRSGPNPFEAAWEVVGKRECKQCGIYRCELHQHIKSWMPKELEYCSLKQNFGLPADTEGKPSCFRGKPSKPHRCGRHPSRTTSMHQDDNAV